MDDELVFPDEIYDEEEDLPSNELIVAARASIIHRCGISNIKYQEENDEEDSYLRIYIGSGRGTREVLICDGPDLIDFESIKFEKYTFLTGYEAICSYELKTIEASISFGNRSSNNAFNIRKLSRYFTENGSEIKLDTVSDNLPSIEIGSMSNELKELTRNSSGQRKISIKLKQCNCSTHDSAIELLRKISNAILFQIDLKLDMPMLLTRERVRNTRIRIHGSPNTDLVPLSYPRYSFHHEPLSLYWYARSSNGMPLLQYFAFYQVLEYFFPIYAEIEARQKVKSILKDPRFRSDHEPDIAKLINSISSNRNGAYGDERSQLKATIQNCVEAEDIKQFIESDENRKNHFTTKSKSSPFHKIVFSSPIDLLNEIAERIYEIRCKIVHSKNDMRDKDKDSDVLLPFSKEADQLVYDIELTQYIAQRVLISNGKSINA
jgi:hypothetical protein